jgi:hypothetical protein
LEMTHDTLLDDKDGMQEQLKRIMEDFSKLAPERQQAIIKRIGDKVKDKLEAEFKKLGDEFLDILPDILEEIESKQDGKQGGG